MKTWNGFEKGINLGGWLSQWDLTDREHLETFITEQDIQDIRAMGADHVRLPVDYSLIEEEDGTPKDENFICFLLFSFSLSVLYGRIDKT